MAVSPGFRSGAIALLVLVLTAGAATALALPGASGKLALRADERVLRLHDLPPGYRLEDDSGCGPIAVEGESDQMRRFILEQHPEVCGYSYERLFRPPGPKPTAPLVGAGVLAVADAAGAARLFELAIASVGERTGREASRELIPAPALGEEARLFRTKELVEGRAYQPATMAVWRQGQFVGSLVAAGLAPVANDRVALELAAVQQSRMLAPTPYTAAEKSDVTVALDDPALRFPVFWLGETFRPGHGLPRAVLTEASTFKHRGEGPPGQKASLWYEAFTLGLWTRSGWKAFERSVLGPLNRKWRCTRSTRIELARGHADVFAAYGRNFRTCPDRAPDRYYAIAHLGGVTVGVNLIQCTRCLGPGGGPYNSLEGMKAIVRGFTLRPKRVF